MKSLKKAAGKKFDNIPSETSRTDSTRTETLGNNWPVCSETNRNRDIVSFKVSAGLQSRADPVSDAKLNALSFAFDFRQAASQQPFFCHLQPTDSRISSRSGDDPLGEQSRFVYLRAASPAGTVEPPTAAPSPASAPRMRTSHSQTTSARASVAVVVVVVNKRI